MDNIEILEAIRNLSKEKNPKNDISNYLEKHHCLYMMKIANNFNRNNYGKIVSSNTINVLKKMTYVKDLISQIDFPYVIFKGNILSYLSYGSPFLRLSCDVDFLIEKENVCFFKDILIKEGFVQGKVVDNKIIPYSRQEIIFQNTFSHQIPQFVKKIDSVVCPFLCIDINTNVMFGESNIVVDTSEMLKDAVEISLTGCSFKTLNIEKGFIALCLHHFKDINSLFLLTQGSYSINLFCDIFFYLKNQEYSIEKMLKLCKYLRIGGYVYAMIHYTNLIFKDSLLDRILCDLDSLKDFSLIDTFGLSDNERKVWKIDFYERLFHDNLAKYVFEQLTDAEKEKVTINFYNM